MCRRSPLSVGSLLLGGYSWMGGESPSVPGAALGQGVSPHRPMDCAGLGGQGARHKPGPSLLMLDALLSRGRAVAYAPRSVTTHASRITLRLS